MLVQVNELFVNWFQDELTLASQLTIKRHDFQCNQNHIALKGAVFVRRPFDKTKFQRLARCSADRRSAQRLINPYSDFNAIRLSVAVVDLLPIKLGNSPLIINRLNRTAAKFRDTEFDAK